MPSDSPMVGSATLVIEASRTTTNCAMQRRARACQRRCWRVPASVIWRSFLVLGVPPAGPLCHNRNLSSASGLRTIRNIYSVCSDVEHTAARGRTPQKDEMATTTAPATAAPAPGQRADARRNHRRILETARELFAEHGYDTQMEHIARHAGVGVGTVYRHFPNKEDLLQALIVAR